MNDFVGTERDPSRDAAPSEVGATLFAFLEAANHLRTRITEVLCRVGLSYPKYEVLRQLREAKEPLSLGALAECQQCARSNITQLVDRLEADGLVRRVQDPSDRRAVRAELTPAGATLAEQGAIQIAAVREEFEAAFTPAERKQLGALLDRIRF
ncbi:MAG: MarR family transcriptional regulator [Gemmatimonadetes bacterium]|nr:MarR family transcriptional regulator [Gemmatimonadota bacterium]